MENNQELARTNKNKQNQEEAKNTAMYPASGPSCGGNTPTAALAYSLYISSVYKYRALLELYEEQWWELSEEDGAWGEMMLVVVGPSYWRMW